MAAQAALGALASVLPPPVGEGRMLGVLLTAEGRILKAVSGHARLPDDSAAPASSVVVEDACAGAADWAPPVMRLPQEQLAIETRVAELGQEMARLQAAHGSLAHAERERQQHEHLKRVAQRKAERRRLSQQSMAAIEQLTVLRSQAHGARSLRHVAQRPMPSGTGNCCAPKLLQYAHTLGLTPVGMAEAWWGPPSPDRSRVPGLPSLPCENKCRPLLGFMLCPGPRRRRRACSPRPYNTAQPRHQRPPPDAAAMHRLRLSIVHRTDDYVVVNKPSGMLAVPGKDPSLHPFTVVAHVRALFPHATGPMTVHRLDMDTSGLMLVALTPQAQRALSMQFEAKQVAKRYIAIVEGQVAASAGVVKQPFRVDFANRPYQMHDPERGKMGHTQWHVLHRNPTHTWLALFPKTGRTHQLRIHTAFDCGLGHPIVGDPWYGDPNTAERLLLHAESITFTDPGSGQPCTVTAPAYAEFAPHLAHLTAAMQQRELVDR